MISRKIFNFESKILNDLTLEKEGYLPDKFGEQSAKFIWASCRFCGEPSRIRKGFFNNSGSACHKECKLKEQALKSPFKDIETREKSKKTNLERYGVEYASQNKDIAKKISDKTKEEDYKTKLKNTINEKYGVDHIFQSNEFKIKSKETNLERYGVDHAMKNIDILDKTNKTNLEKYGVERPLQSPEIMEKVKMTNIKRYGCENPQRNIKIKDKTVISFNKSVIDDKNNNYLLINTLRSQIFWDELSNGTKSLKEVCEKFNINYRSVTNIIIQDEFKNKYYSLYSFPNQQKQLEIKKELEKIDSNILFNDRKVIYPLELDIYLPDKKFAIEFNGSFWHSEACLESKEARMKHRKKLDLCRKQGIRLFNIFEGHWENRKVQILNFIKTILGSNTIKVPARKCVITNTECKQFIEDNHIQGYGLRTLKFFNLEYNGEIVASMTVSKHHRQNINGNPIVLNRLCFKDGVSVQGGSSKLFKKLLEWTKGEGYDRVISWSDNCWTEGDIYKVLGFSLVSESGPDYFYWNNRDKKYYSKQSQQKKKVNCPEGMTEREWCIEREFFRIWDCGKKHWEFVL